MSAGTYNFTIEQGTTFQQDFVWNIDNVAVDVTGYSARMMVRSSVASSTVLDSWNTDNGRMTIGTSDGRFSIFLPSTDCAAIEWTTGVYDIELVSPAATPIVTRILKGTITIDPEVTR